MSEVPTDHDLVDALNRGDSRAFDAIYHRYRDWVVRLARRFYVRAVQADTTDKTAQGYLGCAMVRLGRRDEGQRWLTRAGPGNWSSCGTMAPGTPMPGAPMPGAPAPGAL